MPLMVDVDEAAARLPEMLAEVEAGREVVISRGAEPIAKLGALSAAVANDADAAVTEIRAARKDFGSTTIDEILAWRDEGRR